MERYRFVVETSVGRADRRGVVALSWLYRACVLQAQAGIGERRGADHERRPLHPMRQFEQTMEVPQCKRPTRLLEILLVRRFQCIDQGDGLITEAVELVHVETRDRG